VNSVATLLELARRRQEIGTPSAKQGACVLFGEARSWVAQPDSLLGSSHNSRSESTTMLEGGFNKSAIKPLRLRLRLPIP